MKVSKLTWFSLPRQWKISSPLTSTMWPTWETTSPDWMSQEDSSESYYYFSKYFTNSISNYLFTKKMFKLFYKIYSTWWPRPTSNSPWMRTTRFWSTTSLSPETKETSLRTWTSLSNVWWWNNPNYTWEATANNWWWTKWKRASTKNCLNNYSRFIFINHKKNRRLPAIVKGHKPRLCSTLLLLSKTPSFKRSRLWSECTTTCCETKLWKMKMKRKPRSNLKRAKLKRKKRRKRRKKNSLSPKRRLKKRLKKKLKKRLKKR